MTKHSITLATAALTALLVAGCGSQDTAEKPTDSGSKKQTSSSTHSSPSPSTTTPSPTEPSPTPSESKIGDAPISKQDLQAMAKKVGCTRAQVQKSGGQAAVSGAAYGAKCEVGKTGYLFVMTKNKAAVGAGIKSLRKAVGQKAPLPYLHGSNWFMIAGDADAAEFTDKEPLVGARKMIGGTLATEG